MTTGTNLELKTENRVRPRRYRIPTASNQQEHSALNLPPNVVDLSKEPLAPGIFSKIHHTR